MERFSEIDALRGIAIIMMVIFHFMFDLSYFGILKQELYQGAWLIFQRITITLFLLLVGASLHLAYSRMKDKGFVFVLKKFSFRAAMLGAIALLITIGTYYYLGKGGYVIFGIIHFIALATLLAVPFLMFSSGAGIAIFSLLSLASGFVFDSITSALPWLLWLGIKPVGFYTVDYVPVFPWFGIVLFGIFLGKKFYPQGKRNFPVELYATFVNSKAVEVVSFLGRNSLVIYLIHQPIMITVLSLIFKSY